MQLIQLLEELALNIQQDKVTNLINGQPTVIRNAFDNNDNHALKKQLSAENFFANEVQCFNISITNK